VSDRSSGSIPCAEIAPNKARVRSSTKWLLANRSAGRSARRPIADDAAKQPHVRRAVAAETCRRLLHRPFDHRRRSIVEGMRELGRRLDELEPIFLQWQRPQKRRRNRHRMHRRADIVIETRQREFSRSCTTADCRLRLEDRHLPPGLSKGDRRREAVWPRADHDGIRLRHVASDL
jgi:hypothetical protein